MTIKIVGGEQVVCDCKGDTTDTWVDRLLVGITEEKDSIIVQVYCPNCEASRRYIVRANLLLDESSLS